jgi:hypothetical protein
MKEGWLNDDYLVLFSEEEVDAISSKYGISQSLPNYALVGLRGWDDFIVQDSRGALFTVPTVPIGKEHIEPFSLPENPSLKSDGRFTGKIKWYVKPLVFGGDLKDSENLIWVSHEQHAELVAWWNNQYRALKTKT